MRVLIKVAAPLSVETVIKDVFSDVLAVARKQELGLDDRPQELLEAHAVIREKARHSSGRGQHDAEPACGVSAEPVSEKQIDARGNTDGKNRAEELTCGQAEENALLVLPDFLRDFDFLDIFCLLFVRKFDRVLETRDNSVRKSLKRS